MKGQARDTSPPWDLISAFDINRGDVVSFVGGGGKTTAMFRLAQELASHGWRVLSTTTTHLDRNQSRLAPAHLIYQDHSNINKQVKAALERVGHVLVTGRLTENELKWGGVPPLWITSSLADLVLVEADGAKHRSFKAPASHEPVVPTTTSLLIPVVGVDAVGKRVDEAAFRIEQVCQLTGLAPDDYLSEKAIARTLSHPDGGLKGRPPGSRVRILINKTDTPTAVENARAIARHLLSNQDGNDLVQAVIFGAMMAQDPIREVRRRVAAVVLAAGSSMRMKGTVPKQLLPWRGKTVIRTVIDGLSACPVKPLRVITGHRANDIEQVLEGTRAELVFNPHYTEGEMLSSLQTGIRTLNPDIGGCLVILGDQPWIESKVVNAILDAYATGRPGFIVPTFQQKRGHPVLIDRQFWPELLEMPPGLAPRHLLGRHPGSVLAIPVESENIIHDIDTWDDYAKALNDRP